MNIKKLQLEVCKALTDEKKQVISFRLGNGQTAITINGRKSVVFYPHECIFDLAKTENREPSEFNYVIRDDDKILNLTNKIFIHESKMLHKLNCEDFDIYANVKYVAEFDECEFYAFSPRSRILCVEKTGTVRGMIMPVNFTEDMAE